MRILVTGRGKSGSWKIRGEQIGAAIGADVTPNATHFRGYDVTILVKRPRPGMVAAIHDAGVKLVWDIVDAWPQPDGNDWDEATCIDWLQREVEAVKPAAIVAATKAMAADCAQFSVPVLALPHHARPGQRINPLRETVRTVGYEGGDYLGHWREKIERECATRGWSFVTNPAELADVDIVVALRHQTGYAPQNWKSNVKLANAQGSGTPIICNREAGYLETADGGVCLADDEADLHRELDFLTKVETRRMASTRLLASASTLAGVAEDYLAWLSRLKS